MLAPIFLNMLLLYGVAAIDIGEASDVKKIKEQMNNSLRCNSDAVTELSSLCKCAQRQPCDVGEGVHVGVLDARTGDDAATGTGAGAEDAGESSGEARERGKEETEVWVKQGRS